MNPDINRSLDRYFDQVSDIILARQNPITGLLPASTAVNAHGDYTDAWVRDNVYSILAAWGLALAYRRIDESDGRTVLLEQSVVKLMRGLLIAMMKQADKVETFKKTQDPLHSLHAKYETATGDPVVGDDEWGHLQVDATSLFLLMLAQMTASGLRIVFSLDEVNFVQNLVHYIGRAYRTPDYGIWERGNKINHGITEVNSSSVGMAKAALEALDGFNLFGTSGGQASVVHVVPDEVARARITLESRLPAESLSKEVDAATLSVVGYPAFAIENEELVSRTVNDVVEKLEGRYGCKRFLRDGHQTVVEDPSRLHYEPEELRQFEHIECEWPLFFTYLLLYYLFLGNEEKAREYREKLESLVVDQDGQGLLPELYIVPEDSIEAERERPRSQRRVANENVPLVWAQSLFILGALIQDDLLGIEEIDPLGRRQRVGRQLGRRIQLALIAQDRGVKHILESHGIVAEAIDELAPVAVRPADGLAQAYCQLGRNDRLGLSGRPLRHLRGLATSSVYYLAHKRMVFQSQFMNRHDFYLTLDNRMLVERLKMELAYVAAQWDAPGRPVVVFVVDHSMLGLEGSQALLEFMEECQSGSVNGTPVQLGRMGEFVPTAGRERIDYLHDHCFLDHSLEPEDRRCFMVLPMPTDEALSEMPEMTDGMDDAELLGMISGCGNPEFQVNVMTELVRRHGVDYDTGLKDIDGQTCLLRDLIEELYIRTGDMRLWSVVRRCAALLEKHDIDLEGAATEIVVRRKGLSVARSYSRKSTIRRPTSAREIIKIIRAFNEEDYRAQILTQELVLYLGLLIRSDPDIFKDMGTVRVGHILQLISARLRNEKGVFAHQAIDFLMAMPPHEIYQALREALTHYEDAQNALYRLESMRVAPESGKFIKARFPKDADPALGDARSWLEWRQLHGSIGRQSETFFEGVWDLVSSSRGLVIGDQWNPKRRLDHSLCADMTRGEHLFEEKVEHLLNKIDSPGFRQLNLEALNALIAVVQQSYNLRFEDTLFVDVIIGHAVRLRWCKQNPEKSHRYNEHRTEAWDAFYDAPPHQVANSVMDALAYLLNTEEPLDDIETAPPEDTHE